MRELEFGPGRVVLGDDGNVLAVAHQRRSTFLLSEETDALVIVVSEETAQISLAHRGRLERNVSLERLHEALTGKPAAPAALRG